MKVEPKERLYPHVFLLSVLVAMNELNYSHAESTLIAISMITRHGDRTPVTSYPLDPYKNYPWPGGYGALSEKGAVQLFEAGFIKADRYSALLNSSGLARNKRCLNANSIYVRSSVKARCVESTKRFLDGFLGTQWPEDIIEIVPQNEDTFLVIPGKGCPKFFNDAFAISLYDQEVAKVLNVESEEGKNVIKQIEENTGMVVKSVKDLLYLEDTLFVQIDHGLPLPQWAHSVYSRYLEPLALMGFDIICSGPYMQIRSGVFLKDITKRLESVVRGKSNQNTIFYLTHDFVMGGLYHALNIRDQIIGKPDYGATLSFEIHSNTKLPDDFEVKLFYFRNYQDARPQELSIPGCGTPCSFKKFKESLESKITLDHDDACSH